MSLARRFSGSGNCAKPAIVFAIALAVTVLLAPAEAQGSAGAEIPQAVLVDSNDRIVVAAHAFDQTNASDFAAVRYESTGSLDPFFGSGGVGRVDLGSSEDGLLDAALQRDGKILLAGYYRPGDSGPPKIGLARLTPAGTLDSTFGVSGISAPGIPPASEPVVPNAVTTSRAGRIYVAGSCECQGASLFVARLMADGTPDPAYGGGDGWVAFEYDTQQQTRAGRIREIALDSAGRLVIAAHSACCDLGAGLMLSRLQANGQIDTSFGTGGRTYTILPSPSAPAVRDHEPTGLLLTAQGIYVAGNYEYSYPCGGTCFGSRGFIARYTALGAPDSGFSEDGVVFTGQNGQGSPAGMYLLSGIAPTAGGIGVGGISYTPATEADFAFGRYSPNGDLLGETSTHLGAGEFIRDLAIDTDGRPVVSGITTGSTYDIGVARYSNAGLLDTSFCQSGTVVTDLSGSLIKSTSCLVPPPGPPPPPDSGGPDPGDPPAVIDLPDSGGCASPEDPRLSESDPPDWIEKAADETGGFLTDQALASLVNRRPHLGLLLKAYKYSSFVDDVLRVINWGVEVKELAARWQDLPCRAAFIDDLADPETNPETAALLEDLTPLSSGSSWRSLSWSEKVDPLNLNVAECELQHEGNPTAGCINGHVITQFGFSAIRKWWGI